MFFVSDDDVVKHSSGNFSNFADVIVSSVANAGDDSDFLVSFHTFQEILNRLITRWIMRKIDHYFEIFEVEDIQSSRCQLCTWDKGRQSQSNIWNFEAVNVSRQ
ncbi:hypothetical protein D3C86_1496140 [compost metagenome]